MGHTGGMKDLTNEEDPVAPEEWMGFPGGVKGESSLEVTGPGPGEGEAVAVGPEAPARILLVREVIG